MNISKLTLRLRQILLSALVLVTFNGMALAQSVVVQILNGRNGKPISKIRVWVGFDEKRGKEPLDLKTDRQGEVQFETNGAKTFQVSPVGVVPCREQQFTTPIDYSIEEILKKGIVTRNDCGQSNPEPSRGRLKYIVRPATSWKLFKN
jgi:hypothetical protein